MKNNVQRGFFGDEKEVSLFCIIIVFKSIEFSL